MKKTLLQIGMGLMVGIQACETIFTKAHEEHQILDGPIEGLSSSQQITFLAGDEAFSEVFTPQTGLGPYFVANACNACHPGDGKGHPSNRLTRFGRLNAKGQFDPMEAHGGPQLQHRAIPGFEGETLPQQATGITSFVAPAVTGLGFLEAVTDQTLLALSDPEDQDGNGISGVPNYITPPGFFRPRPQPHHMPDGEKRYIGRFGKKAGAIDLLMQTVRAYKNDMGITSDFDPVDPVNLAVSILAIGSAESPEVSSTTVNNLVFYLKTLKAPIRRNQNDNETLQGEALFGRIGCTDCHQPTLTTGVHPVQALSKKTFHPYTDLLMHDMGEGLDDHYTEGTASTSEWKTPALWGLGLSKRSQGGQYFLLHDGRARSIDEAIVLHGGEAAKAAAKYRDLSQQDKTRIIQFLESL